MPDPGSSDIPTRLFATYVQRTEAGEDLDFDAFCDEHTAHADALHRLKQDWERIQGVLENLGASGTLSERIKTRHGSEADPNITLDDEGSSSDLATELIDRLGSLRRPAVAARIEIGQTHASTLARSVDWPSCPCGHFYSNAARG